MSKTNIQKHFDKIASNYDDYTKKRSFHYTELKKLIKKLVGKNKNVLEIGCGTGDVLYSLTPKYGYGMDISGEMIRLAKSKYKSQKNLKFSTAWPKQKFDVIFMSDVVEHLEDPETIFIKISKLLGKNGIFINTMANPLWEPILMLWEKLGWKMPEGPHRRSDFGTLKTIIDKAGMKIVNHDYTLLVPIKIPIVTKLFNKYLEAPLKRFAFIEFFVCNVDHLKK